MLSPSTNAPGRRRRRGGVLVLALAAVMAAAAPAASAAPPDPLARGPYGTEKLQYKAGSLQLTVPSLGGVTSPVTINPGESTKGAGNTFEQDLEGTVTVPTGGSGPWKVLLFQHGRHSTCVEPGGTSESLFPFGDETECADDPATGRTRIRNWEGYDYLSDLLASHGYVVMSVDANAVHTYDNNTLNPLDAGALARAQIIANSFDLLYKWNDGAGPGEIGTKLTGKLEMQQVGIMGHSRGGEGVTQFITYNRQRPTPGRRYNLQAVFALAPIDRNKQYPVGTNYATLLPACDGDVSTLSGANAFERGKYAAPTDPFAKVEYVVNGADHNFYNTIWTGDDRGEGDAACGPSSTNSIRLSPADQRRTGLATIATFLRVYLGKEAALAPWTTGEAGYPQSACPTGRSVGCADLVKQSYIAPAGERQDVVRPSSGSKPTTAAPTASDDAGGQYSGSGFSQFEWCNPDTFNQPNATAATPIAACPGPGIRLPGASATSDPSTPTSFNRAFGPQLAVAWDKPATLSAELRGGARDVSKFRTLSLRAGVQITDTIRNPVTDGFTPSSARQDFKVALVDRTGASYEVKLTDFSRGVEGSVGSTTRHILLNGFRIPLSAFVGKVDLANLDRVELRFGGQGVNATGALQIADVAFQELGGPDAPAATLNTVAAPTEKLPSDPVLPKVDAVKTDDPAETTPAGVCLDTTDPTVALKGLRTGGGLTARGTAADGGCAAVTGKKAAPGKIQRVQVTVATKAAKRKCRYLLASGKLSKPLSCKSPVSVIASGTTSWKVAAKHLKAGSYTVSVRAIDGAGNLSKTTSRRVRVG